MRCLPRCRGSDAKCGGGMAQVAEPQRAAFVEVMQELQIVRLRDGASRWDLFRDTGAPERFLETFVVGSWAEHLRQHERVTNADRNNDHGAVDVRYTLQRLP